MRTHFLLLGLLALTKAHAAPVFSSINWNIFTGASPERDSFVASFPADFTVFEDFEDRALHPRIETLTQVQDLAFCCTAGGAGSNTTPGGQYALASDVARGLIVLRFLTPIDSLVFFVTGMRAPEVEHAVRVFDGRWYEFPLVGWDHGVGFVAPGSQVTAVHVVTRVAPGWFGSSINDHFAIDDLYVHFTREPTAIPEPGTILLTFAAAAGLLARQCLQLHR